MERSDQSKRTSGNSAGPTPSRLMTPAPPTSTPNRSGCRASRSVSTKWTTAGGGAAPGSFRRSCAARSISRKLERRSSMARIASVSDARAAVGSKGTRRTTDLPVTLSITQTSTESGERSPTMATTASAPRRAASCSRRARESPAALPAASAPSRISVSKPAEISSPFSRTRVSTITGGEFAGGTMHHAGRARARRRRRRETSLRGARSTASRSHGAQSRPTRGAV